jgi:hypothetical protein
MPLVPLEEYKTPNNEEKKLTPLSEYSPKITEENIKTNKSWIDSSKTLYEWDWNRKNPNKETPKLSDSGYAEWGLNYGGGLAYSDVDLISQGGAISNANDKQKEAFVNLIDLYDKKEPSFAGFGRALGNIINPLESPTTYLGLGTGKLLSTGVKQAAKDKIKSDLLKSLAKNRVARYAAISAAEGAPYAAGYDALRQRALINAEGQEEFDLASVGKSAGIGAALGGVLGGATGAVVNRFSKPKQLSLPAPKAEEAAQKTFLLPKPKEAIPKTKPETLARTTVKGEVDDISSKIEDIADPIQNNLNVVPDTEVGVLGKIPFVGPAYKKLANLALNKIQKISQPISPLKGLPEQPKYLGLRGMATGKLEQTRDLARNVFQSFNKLTPKENKPVYEFLTGTKNIDEVPVNLQNSALELRKGIDTVSEVLEKNGLISTEVMQENFGTYLPRLFLKYFNKKSNSMGYLKKRKDLDAATREFLGEIEDVGLLGAKAIEDPISDVVKLGFFREVSKNPNWALQDGLVNFRGRNVSPFYLKEEVNRITNEIAEGLRPRTDIKIVKELEESIGQAQNRIAKADVTNFKKLPDNKKYGELRGAYIRKEIHDDIINTPIVARDEVNSIFNMATQATKAWKLLKVPLNPPSVFRNLMSNMVLLNLSGISFRRLPKRLAQAINEVRTKGKYYEIAKKYGATGTTFSRQEMLQINDIYAKAKVNTTGSATDKAKVIIGNIAKFGGDSYALMEEIGKIAKVIDDMEKGLNPETAVYNAQKTLFDYSLVPKTLKKLRENPFGVPFGTFQYKVLPFLLETFIRYPERYAKYMAIPPALAVAWQAKNNLTEDDLEILKKSLPEYLRDSGNALVLPIKDSEGRWQFFDWSYNMPWGFYTGVGSELAKGDPGQAAQDIFNLVGGPGFALMSITTNKDPFTQRPIYNESAPPTVQGRQILEYLWTTAAPTFLTDRGVLGKLIEATTKEGDPYSQDPSRPKVTLPQAASRFFGVNIYPVDPEDTKSTNLFFMNKELSDLKVYYKKEIREARNRGDEAREEELKQEWSARSEALQDQIRIYRAQTDIPEGLKVKREE